MPESKLVENLAHELALYLNTNSIKKALYPQQSIVSIN